MANPPDEDLSAAARNKYSVSEGPLPREVDPASRGEDVMLSWVARHFRFDPTNRRTSQPTVKDLQEQLAKHGVGIASDGILGRQTIDAINRLGPSLWPIEVETEAASTAFGTSKLGNVQQRAGAERQPGQAESEAGSGPPPSPDNERATARPVALSDSAISDVAQDRLSFRPYVEAVAEFILAQQTRPPLAIAINARWGQGKTSFMNMLDAQLKRLAPQTTTRVATTWFNPWKYSEPEQVWAAFVANVTRCLQDNLSPPQRRRFKRGRFKQKWDHHADLALKLRLAVAVLFVVMVLTLPFTLDLPAFHGAIKDKEGILGAFYAATESINGWLWWLLFIPFALLSVLYGYITFTKNLGLNLLEYIEKTDFKDKIGTLSQFEDEMRRLADAVPEDLKVVVFIDDLDRCKGKVLGEIIEALQLADVSRACIFVMGMDLRLVAEAIERDRVELAQSAGSGHRMEHGSGYKFLEKIIQARLSLPAHVPAQMDALVASAMGHAEAPAPAPTAPDGTSKPGLVEHPHKGDGQTPHGERRTPSDSGTVLEKARHYGSRHFDNPRQLKRFINGFRLQTYLAAAVRPGLVEIDRLARFLVLAEKWPAVLDYMLKEELGSLELVGEEPGHSTNFMSGEIAKLPRDRRDQLYELLDGPGDADLLNAQEWKGLADWCGFTHYRSVAKSD